MYKTIVLKPCEAFYDDFVSSFADEFKLAKLKAEERTYYYENEDMLVRIMPKVAEIVMHDGSNYIAIRKLNDFFSSYCCGVSL